jgi:glycosyltransferase involved in cell wall biosynthesis
VITSRLLKMLNKKILMTVHGGSIPERMQKDPSRFLQSLKRADKIVTPSRFLQHELSQYNLSTTVIENVLPVKQYPFQSKKKFRPKVLWMRTFEDIYNPFMAVDVALLLAEKYDGFEMIMAGADRGLLAATKQYANEKGLGEKICFPGFISDEQKIRYAQDYDFFISTNNVDNAPVSLVEFMALGLPVISTKAGGVPYMIENNKNGFLVDMNDAAGMANKIVELIEHPDQAHAIACNARKYAEQYDEDVVMEKWRELLLNFGN